MKPSTKQAGLRINEWFQKLNDLKFGRVAFSMISGTIIENELENRGKSERLGKIQN